MSDMHWLSAVETGTVIDCLPFPETLLDCFAASKFLNRAFYSADYEPGPVWETAVALSESGETLAQHVIDSGIELTPSLLKFTFFRLFYFNDLLIDYQQTDFSAILEELRGMHTRASAKWPYVFGHCLYHKFNDTDKGNRTTHLEAKSAEDLLRGTPAGVFQVGTLLSGPLGFLRSRESRHTPPTLRLPLWHCSDLGCQSLHVVEVMQFDTRQLDAYRTVSRFLTDRHGRPSEWHGQLARLASNRKYPNGRPYADMAALIGDCVVGSELPALLGTVLQSSSGQPLRDCLAGLKGLRGSTDAILSGLSREEMHQMILMLSDPEIVHFLDEAISRGEIEIPPTEVRAAKTYRFLNTTS
jgi:hypothetical protein